MSTNRENFNRNAMENALRISRCADVLPASTKVTSRSVRPPVRPVLLSYQRYDKLLYNAFQSDDINAREDRKVQDNYLTDLKNHHLDLVQYFGANVAKSKEEKLHDIKKQIEERVIKLRTANQFNMDVLEHYRQQKLEKCEEMLKKNKPGFRELNAAVIHSEVLHARCIQQKINAELENSYKENEQLLDAMDKKCDLKAPYLQEPKVEEENKAQVRSEYKKELLQTILKQKQEKIDAKNALIKEEIAEREKIDKEVQEQIAKEKAALEKKKTELRKNAAEAMKMAEERKQREIMFDNIDDRLNCVFNVGQQYLKKKVLDTRQDIINAHLATKDKLCEEVYKKIQANNKNYENAIKRDVENQQLKFTAQEEEKRKRDRSLKQARIEAYLQEMEEIKAANARQKEEQRFETAKRLKNTQVNALFDEQTELARKEEQQKTAAMYTKQIEEKKTLPKDLSSGFLNTYDKDDRFFFEYALQLMEDAKAAGRPLYPFAKVVEKFKKDNHILTTRETLPHLKSNFTINQMESAVNVQKPIKNAHLFSPEDCCNLPAAICNKHQHKQMRRKLGQKSKTDLKSVSNFKSDANIGSKSDIKLEDLTALSDDSELSEKFRVRLSAIEEDKVKFKLGQIPDRQAMIDSCLKITQLLESTQKNICNCPVVRCFRDGLRQEGGGTPSSTSLSPSPPATGLKWVYNKNELNSLNKEKKTLSNGKNSSTTKY